MLSASTISKGLRANIIAPLAVTLVLSLLPQPAHARIQIEQLQRNFQARFHYVTQGNYVVWPQCQCTPAPLFPPDDFYGDLDKDKTIAASLVQDLSTQFYGSYSPLYLINGDAIFSNLGRAPLYSRVWLKTSGDLEGANSVPDGYVEADFPKSGSGFDLQAVTTNRLFG